MMGIALGASLGAHLVWVDSTLRWFCTLIAAAVVWAGGAAGAYLGLAYGPGLTQGTGGIVMLSTTLFTLVLPPAV